MFPWLSFISMGSGKDIVTVNHCVVDSERLWKIYIEKGGESDFFRAQKKHQNSGECKDTAASKQRVHAVLQCNEMQFGIALVNAAEKIFAIFMFAAANNNQRPAVFERN
ncbi:hypothetical protein BDF20DRAFT_987466 [Mycotypha africana]|uniref:uncharacterized protein n=1 Tax=Mycotypha africana TaxID=64632 RepID=UPI002301CB20|nr:uncharacterized protein BDF20DRAFT_987466 [Mycotypha africana]KAI8979155.1 hypothetical protein BDF20DRAFT_987466 [Mycotypha africana]